MDICIGEDLKELIQERFANCTSVEEVAEVYADVKMENQKQMEYMMKQLTNKNNNGD